MNFSEFNDQLWFDQGKTEISLLVPNVKISSSTLSEEGTTMLVCTPRILAGASLEAGVTSLMRRILEACSWRLTVFVRGYVASDEKGLPLILTLPLMMMRMITTSLGPGVIPRPNLIIKPCV